MTTGRSARCPLRLLAAAAGLALAAAACAGDSTTEPPARDVPLAWAPVDSGYDFPVLVAAPAGDTGRLFVVERGGRVWLRRDGARRPTPWLDLGALMGPDTDGLLGLAFHPRFAENRRLFVYYVGADAQGRVAEYRATADLDGAEPQAVRTLLTVPYQRGSFTNGGTIAFGPDGRLYVGLGDGSDGPVIERAQDSTRLEGKMLRLDVDAAAAGAPYAVPGDNPYASRAGWRPEIWLLGLRNPFRWSFDRRTGDLWIGDVGENRWEEVSLVRVGQRRRNLGWPVMEGGHCSGDVAECDPEGLLARPVLEYGHDEGCSVTGGAVYRGAAIPELAGTYFYGDFCGGWVRRLLVERSGVASAGPELAPPLPGDNPVAIAEDGAGELNVVFASGRIYRIVRGG